VFLKEKISTFTSTQYNISAISRLPENAALGDRIAVKLENLPKGIVLNK